MKSKIKLSLNNRFIFSFILTIYLLSNSFNSSASSHKVLSLLSSENYLSTTLNIFHFSQPENITPIETNLIPFLMMSLGFILWKVHKKSMKKNDK